MAADNDLEEYAIQDINEMEMVGSTNQVSVVVQIDRADGHDTSNGDWTSTRRYYIIQDSDGSVINSTLLEDLGELNMAAPETLEAFVQWGTQTYPADYYLLALWDHGRGWRTRTLAMMERQIKAIHADDTSSDEMSLEELTQAFASLGPLDIVLFDACLMGMLEVAYSIKDAADLMIASEENIPVQGQPYHRLLGELMSRPALSPRDLCRVVVGNYISYYSSASSTFTLSAVDLLTLDNLVFTADTLATAITANLSTSRSGVRTAAQQTQHYDFDYGTYTDYKDLYDFARRVKDLVPDASVQSAASDVMSAVNSLIVAEQDSGGKVADSYGVAIYLPAPGSMLNYYRTISFAQDTHWDEFLTAY